MINENLSLRVRCIIKSDDRFLLIQQNVSDKDRLIFPGGGVHSGETLLQALYREVKEEIGITIPENLSPQLKAIREISIKDYYRCIEMFFMVDFGSGYEWSELAVNSHENIRLASLYSIEELSKLDPKPDFWKEVFQTESTLFFASDFSLSEYVSTFNDVPLCKDRSEMVHVMLKPDTLEANNQERVISDLILAGGNLVFREKLRLTKDQLSTIYFDFSFENARELVFDYLTQNETEHLVFTGKPGLHKIFNNLKGKTGGSTGLRSKYVGKYTKLDKKAFQEWLSGNHPSQNTISLEMFCCNVLHVATTPVASNKAIKSILL